LPTGHCIRTGFGRFAAASATHAYRWGVGPALDGLFTQSNLGIVTQMTVWLMPQARFFQAFQFTVPTTDRLGPVVDALQSLMMHGVLQDNSLILSNSYKVLMRNRRYPWKMTGGRTPFSIKARTGAEPWYANGQVYSPSRDRGLADRALIEQALGPHVTQLAFFDQDTHDLLNTAEIGVPNDSNLKALYWRKRKEAPPDIDPHGDLCGVLYLLPVLPLDGDLIVKALQLIEPAILQHGFEPNVNVTCISARAVHVGIVLIYDREVPGEDERAMQCHDHLLEQLVKQGHFPGRLGIQSMDRLPRPEDHSAELIRTLKRALDPNDILAPGRYDFRTHWPAQDLPNEPKS
jgi:4-cresol dehydrogenase (hydroxylating)